ncbi:MAG TPA: NAD(P)/FAD-dependent oxidoreductase [Candidatus Limnocylindrales bacterium]|nr:NAD(P)/FAD-dependent oxidoreductase [Candidatus Limnocylindrales bacterium]
MTSSALRVAKDPSTGPVANESAIADDIKKPESTGVANPAPASQPHHVVIIGGGFGGLAAARGLANKDGVHVTLIDKRNFHLFQPLLYQVGTGSLSPGDVAAPLREILRKGKNVTVLLGNVTAIDVATRTVALGDAMSASSDHSVPYDTLIVAAGLVSNYFGKDEWERYAPGLKSVEDATEVRSRLLLAFEEAERTSDPVKRRRLLTFVIVGAGPTGVEMAGAISEIAADTLPTEFKRIAHEEIRVVLVDAGPRVLAAFHEKLSSAALRDLTKMGVEVRTSTMVKALDATGVLVEHAGMGGAPAVSQRIDAHVIVWAAGVRGTKLAADLAAQSGAVLTRQCTIEVHKDLTIAGHPEILVIGDAASFREGLERPLPGVAQVAIQQGDYAAQSIVAKLAGKEVRGFEYVDRGSMATIGRAKAVADLNFVKLTGFVAWLAWLFVHLLALVGYENRVLVLTQWAWFYVWRRRSARLITAWQLDEKTPTSFDLA